MTSTLVARPIETRLRPLYATGFIHGFALWYSIEKLFMRPIGLNDYLITIASVFVAGAPGVMCVTLSMIVVRRQ
jgi:hypothetical protein